MIPKVRLPFPKVKPLVSVTPANVGWEIVERSWSSVTDGAVTFSVELLPAIEIPPLPLSVKVSPL